MLTRVVGRSTRLLFSLLLLPLLPACFAYSNVEVDTDDHPVVTTGARAAIIYPGQAPPPLRPPPGAARTEASRSPGARSGSTSGTGSGSGSDWGSEGTLLGGAAVDDVQHREIKQEPRWLKPLLLPFAVMAWPFKKAWDLATPDSEEEPAPVAPTAQPPAPRPADAQAAHEQNQLDRMRQELANRSPQAPSSTPAPRATPPAPSPRRGAPLSIADELAALRAGRTLGATPRAPAPTSAPAPSPVADADRALDRSGDGRPDHWIFGEGGRTTREAFDDDGDGIPNRLVFYDAETGHLVRIEEDLDGDGRIDSWEEYQADQPVRRRADTDGSGAVDAWTFYRDGAPLRHEQDTDHDGFRDRIGYYDDGRLVREEHDRDGDGQPDQVSHFDAAGNLARSDEDSDGDGIVDLSSFYEGGRLVRRELMGDAAVRAVGESLAPMPSLGQGPSEDG